MLYHLFRYLDTLGMPGAGIMQYISSRAALAIILSLLISMVFGNRLIQLLRRQQIGESVRDLGLKGQKEKEGTPTMGGLIILASILLPTLLFARWDNIYILLMLLSTLLFGGIGFIDDYIKVFKKDKRGLAGRFKIIGQVIAGGIIGAVLYLHPDVYVHRNVPTPQVTAQDEDVTQKHTIVPEGTRYILTEDMTTTIPFVKGKELNYHQLIGDSDKQYGWLLFIPVVILVITAVSNGTNMTDGLDGLATGTSAIIGIALAILAYVSGHLKFADYLGVMYIPYSSELVIFIAAFMGGCIGFLWHNAYPAKVFMGDTGSLAIGGIIATFAIIIRKELLLPLLCGVFLAENLSVILQVGWFKYTKRRYGQGRRILLMAPLHHHYQKKGLHEAKIVARFWIVGILLVVMTIATLKIR